MPKLSAGVLVYRRTSDGDLEVLLVHPGGPFYRRKDDGWWSIPKGEPDPGEDLEAAARRELLEELGLTAPPTLEPLGSVKQKGGKVVHAWAYEGDVPEGWVLESNTFEIEWPPRSGRRQAFPEIDRAEWFGLSAARVKLNAAQVALLDRLRGP